MASQPAADPREDDVDEALADTFPASDPPSAAAGSTGDVSRHAGENEGGGDANPKLDPDPGSNTQKDPENWVTKDDPMTGAQASYLKTLSEEANEPFDPDISKGEASKRIDELRKKTGK